MNETLEEAIGREEQMKFRRAIFVVIACSIASSVISYCMYLAALHISGYKANPFERLTLHWVIFGFMMQSIEASRL